jgi:hypothetical protein
MSSATPATNKEDQSLNSEESGKVPQNPQLRRNQKPNIPSATKGPPPQGKGELMANDFDDRYKLQSMDPEFGGERIEVNGDGFQKLWFAKTPRTTM